MFSCLRKGHECRHVTRITPSKESKEKTLEDIMNNKIICVTYSPSPTSHAASQWQILCQYGIFGGSSASLLMKVMLSIIFKAMHIALYAVHPVILRTLLFVFSCFTWSVVKRSLHLEHL